MSCRPRKRVEPTADSRNSDFSKTLFTPAGIDIYLRKSPSALMSRSDDTAIRSQLLERIATAVKAIDHGDVAKMAIGGFEVPGVV